MQTDAPTAERLAEAVRLSWEIKHYGSEQRDAWVAGWLAQAKRAGEGEGLLRARSDAEVRLRKAKDAQERAVPRKHNEVAAYEADDAVEDALTHLGEVNREIAAYLAPRPAEGAVSEATFCTCGCPVPGRCEIHAPAEGAPAARLQDGICTRCGRYAPAEGTADYPCTCPDGPPGEGGST